MRPTFAVGRLSVSFVQCSPPSVLLSIPDPDPARGMK